jgi:hypothetical protein
MLDTTHQVRHITLIDSQLSRLAEVIRSAIASRREAVWCADCDKTFPEGCCQQHLDYLAEADEYAALAHDLGISLE